MQCVLSSRGLTPCIHTNLQPTQVQATQSRETGVNTSTLALVQARVHKRLERGACERVQRTFGTVRNRRSRQLRPQQGHPRARLGPKEGRSTLSRVAASG